MRRILVAVSLTLLLLQTAAARGLPQGESASAQAQLLAAMKLWGDIKFFDPEATDGSVDWDAAFMGAEPAIFAARDRATYRAAIEAMIAPLHDPATHVNDDARAIAGAISVRSFGTVAVVALPHGISSERVAEEAQRTIDIAAGSPNVLFDIRGVTEANAQDVASLGLLFSPGSPLLELLKGAVTLPRERSRAFLGYPNQVGGYAGYSAFDQTGDAVTLRGTSEQSRRFGFLVDGSTSLPSIAIALAQRGEATIYSSGGEPSALSAGGVTIDLPYGVDVTYRTGDLADVASRQTFASVAATRVEDAVANLRSQAPRVAAYAGPPPERLNDDQYASATFPAEAMRLLAVARVYNVIRYFSPYTALMHDDWDAAARQAIDDERGANGARAYVLGLMKFYAHLHDSHGLVWNDTIKAEFPAGVPFDARYLHGQAVVSELYASGGGLHGVRLGDVIDDVDGVAMREAMDQIEAYICASTPQFANEAALNAVALPSVFTGPRGTAITLRFHTPMTGAATAATFVRDVYRVPASPPPRKYFVLPGGVGYVAFDRLDDSDVDAMFDALKNTRAIVFDDRGYPQSDAAWEIAPRLTEANAVRVALFSTPFVIAPTDSEAGDITVPPSYREVYQMLGSAAGSKYLKPTVMLIDEKAISRAEHSALFFRSAHTRFVGTPTDGADGDVTSLVAPGAVRMFFSGQGVRYPDGKQLQRVGILPDVWVEPTAADVARQTDVVLQKGLDEALRLAGASPESRQAAVQQEIARERSGG
jgi:Peptidase family S41